MNGWKKRPEWKRSGIPSNDCKDHINKVDKGYPSNDNSQKISI